MTTPTIMIKSMITTVTTTMTVVGASEVGAMEGKEVGAVEGKEVGAVEGKEVDAVEGKHTWHFMQRDSRLHKLQSCKQASQLIPLILGRFYLSYLPCKEHAEV